MLVFGHTGLIKYTKLILSVLTFKLLLPEYFKLRMWLTVFLLDAAAVGIIICTPKLPQSTWSHSSLEVNAEALHVLCTHSVKTALGS